MDDEAAIRALIGAHFEPMRWDEETEPDWERFSADFWPGAVLIGAARPAQMRSVDGFVARMEDVARRSLESFEEKTRGMEILRFGNVAVVLAASEMLENGSQRNRDVSGYLLVKDDGEWRIAAHAWDAETPAKKVPEHLL